MGAQQHHHFAEARLHSKPMSRAWFRDLWYHKIYALAKCYGGLGVTSAGLTTTPPRRLPRRAKLFPTATSLVQRRSYTFPETGERMPYALLVPPSYSHHHGKVPLLLALHGLDYDESWCFSLSGLEAWAIEHGVVVVAPLGYTRDGWYGCPDLCDGGVTSEKTRRSEEDVVQPCPPRPPYPSVHPPSRGIPPPLLVQMHVLRLVRKELQIDPERVYALGWSMGGGGALRLALRQPRLFAAVLLVAPAGRRPRTLQPRRPAHPRPTQHPLGPHQPPAPQPPRPSAPPRHFLLTLRRSRRPDERGPSVDARAGDRPVGARACSGAGGARHARSAGPGGSDAAAVRRSRRGWGAPRSPSLRGWRSVLWSRCPRSRPAAASLCPSRAPTAA